ncbi:MAG: hypothetical protein ABSG62_00295 [Terracidiphilus sp.]
MGHEKEFACDVWAELEGVRPSRAEDLAAIRRFGSQLYFPECPSQQLFRFSRVTTHVKLVRSLRGVNLADGLFDETLRGRQVRMPHWIHVLPDDHAGSEESQAENSA